MVSNNGNGPAYAGPFPLLLTEPVQQVGPGALLELRKLVLGFERPSVAHLGYTIEVLVEELHHVFPLVRRQVAGALHQATGPHVPQRRAYLAPVLFRVLPRLEPRMALAEHLL